MNPPSPKAALAGRGTFGTGGGGGGSSFKGRPLPCRMSAFSRTGKRLEGLLEALKEAL